MEKSKEPAWLANRSRAIAIMASDLNLPAIHTLCQISALVHVQDRIEESQEGVSFLAKPTHIDFYNTGLVFRFNPPLEIHTRGNFKLFPSTFTVASLDYDREAQHWTVSFKEDSTGYGLPAHVTLM